MDYRADVVVVGAGTAGCVLAARLTEDPGRHVVLIEEGPDPRPIPDVVADPARQAQLVLETDFVRTYDAFRQDGSVFPLLSGKITGGSSSINNLAVVRPMRIDFTTWEQYGGQAWSYESLLPILRSIEADPEFGESDLHGGNGPLVLQRPYHLDDPDPGLQALRQAAHSLGLPDCPDINGPEPYGICASPYAIRDGRRLSASLAYLDPARTRRNLRLLTETSVVRIILQRRRAVGVHAVGTEGPVRVWADQVVLAAGVYHSPQLLMLSGIGPPRVLEDLGIPVALSLPGVGENYQDHAVVHLTFEGRDLGADEAVIPKVRLIARSTGGPVPDLHVFFRPAVRLSGLTPLLPVSVHLLEQRSRGRIVLRSPRPDELPIVQPAMLEDPADVMAIESGVELVSELVRQPALTSYYGPRVVPAPRENLAAYIRMTYTSYHHGVGTCRLGRESDRDAVVGPDLKVRGVDGLWIADASVLPTVPHANTMLATIMIGEVAARHVAGGTSRDPGGAARGQRPESR